METDTTFNRGAVRPIACLNGGCELLRGVYGQLLLVLLIGFLLMFLTGCIPFQPLSSPLMCGVYLCLLTRMYNQTFTLSTLFRGFNYFGQAFIASLIVTVPMLVLSLLFNVGMGGFRVWLDTLKQNKNPRLEEILPVLFGIFGFVFGGIFLLLIVWTVLRTLIAFSYPLIIERRMTGWQAAKLSMRAVMGNFFGILGLVILEFIMSIAGLMFFYVGALFIAPVLFAAWAVAYRRILPAQTTNVPTFNPQNVTSKAGTYLLLASLMVIILWMGSVAGLSYWIYLREEQNRRERTYEVSPQSTPTPFLTPTPSPSAKYKSEEIIVHSNYLRTK